MIPSADTAALPHGGDLTTARRLFPAAPEPFIDLSTGINPHSYPLPQLPSDVFARLPEPAALDRLAAAAAQAYGAPSPDHVVPAPGTQILLPLVAGLVPPGRAAVLGPTYSEHARAAALAGHRSCEVAAVDQLVGADLAVVSNPNNPDGRIVPRAALIACANALLARGGMLVVDEAFMDVVAVGASLAGDAGLGNIVVLRSFGKFYGLAGLRLGFALAAPEPAAKLRALLGPWAVSGAALAVGVAALRDREWTQATQASLNRDTRRLDQLLSRQRLEVVGGTSLFRLVRAAAAGDLFQHLGRAGILVRRFDEQPEWLRFGLPGPEEAWKRLAAALAAFARE
ncbi:MAG TPA: threonine-phosphate decarboxylase CobD [Xanthobacteraceae bacterium]|jgi:cobalamin biosynthetic protein CobC